MDNSYLCLRTAITLTLSHAISSGHWNTYLPAYLWVQFFTTYHLPLHFRTPPPHAFTGTLLQAGFSSYLFTVWVFIQRRLGQHASHATTALLPFLPALPAFLHHTIAAGIPGAMAFLLPAFATLHLLRNNIALAVAAFATAAPCTPVAARTASQLPD